MNNRTDWLNIDFVEHLNIISCDVCIAYLPYYKTLFYILFYSILLQCSDAGQIVLLHF